VEEHLLLAHRPANLSSCSLGKGKANIDIQGFEFLIMLKKLKVKEATFVLPVVEKLSVKVVSSSQTGQSASRQRKEHPRALLPAAARAHHEQEP
jgi:hypothetical protein